jgi:hypothetical protein
MCKLGGTADTHRGLHFIQNTGLTSSVFVGNWYCPENDTLIVISHLSKCAGRASGGNDSFSPYPIHSQWNDFGDRVTTIVVACTTSMPTHGRENPK